MLHNKILIIASHPDDEVLGCGGTIAKFTEKGASVHVAFLADGVSSRPKNLQDHQNELVNRRNAAILACNLLGVKTTSFGDISDNRMDSIDLLDVTIAVEKLIRQYEPDTIFTHHGGDVNIDHQITHRAVVTACRPQQGNPVKTILCFEVPSSTEWQFPGSAPSFNPNWFIDISQTLVKKKAALDCYAAEMRKWPHSRSIQAVEHLARWRGATIGVDAAEAFILGRQIL